MGLEKSLLRGMRIGPVKGRPRGHRAHAEHVHLATLTIELNPAFVPIHLRLAAELIGLRYENLMPNKARGDLALSDIAAHRRLRDFDQRHLSAQTHPDPMRRVALLARRLAISFQNLVDERDRRRQLRPLSFWNFSFRWDCAYQRLSHCPAVNSQRPRYAADAIQRFAIHLAVHSNRLHV